MYCLCIVIRAISYEGDCWAMCMRMHLTFCILIVFICLFILYYRVLCPLAVRRVNKLIRCCIPWKSWRGFSLVYVIITLAVPPIIQRRMEYHWQPGKGMEQGCCSLIRSTVPATKTFTFDMCNYCKAVLYYIHFNNISISSLRMVIVPKRVGAN
jgi:hypothetical protein